MVEVIKEYGGAGVSTDVLTRVVQRIAQADGNFGHIPQNHYYALEVLRGNLATLGLEDRSTVVRGDVMSNIGLVRDATVVLADPPYDFKKWNALLAQIDADLVVAESDRDMTLENPAIVGFEVTRVKRYGRAYVSFLQRLA